MRTSSWGDRGPSHRNGPAVTLEEARGWRISKLLKARWLLLFPFIGLFKTKSSYYLLANLSFRRIYSKMSPLTPEQIASYHENGYLLLRADEHKLVEHTELKQWTQEVQAWPRVKGKWMPYDEININGERQLMRTERFIDYHPKFKSLVCGEQLAGILKAVSGDVSFPGIRKLCYNIMLKPSS